MNTIDFHDVLKQSKQQPTLTDIFSKTGSNRHFRLNHRRMSNVEPKSSTSRAQSIIEGMQEAQADIGQSPRNVSNFDLSLPKIDKSSKKQRGRRIDRNFLQQWLNSALEDEGGKGPLRGVKKYQVDKRHLLGQNISLEEIDKLYHSLYIYTYGFRRVLADLLRDSDTMIIKFWRVFLKLIEQSGQFDNIFGVIDRKYNENMEEMKKVLLRKDQELQEYKKISEERMNSLLRQVTNKNEEIKDLTVQKFVLESNFQLTDQAFNDQVSLRLRFEQKINAINTAYGQLRTKYTRLVEDIKVHRQGSIDHYEKEKEYINEKSNYEMKILELEKMLFLEREKSKMKDGQINEVMQEVADLKQEKLAIAKQEDQEQVQMKTTIMKERKANLRMEEEIDKREAAEKMLIEKNKEIQVLNQSLKKERADLEEQFATTFNLRQIIVRITKEVETKQSHIKLIEANLTITTEKLKKLESETDGLHQTIENLQKQLQFQKKRGELLQQSLNLNQKTIEGMRDSKEKHQKLYKIIQTEQILTMKALNEANSKIFQMEQEKKGFQMMLESKDHHAQQNEGRLKTELEIARNKIQTQSTQINHKDTMFNKANEKIQQLKNSVSEKSYTIQKLQKAVFEMQNTLSRETFDKKNLQNKCKLQEDTIKIHKAEVDRLNSSVIQMKKTNYTLSNQKTNLNYILQEKNKFTESQTQAIKGLLKHYRCQLDELSQHIHPMFYWDKEGQVNKLQGIIDRMLDKIESFRKLAEAKTLKATQLEAQIIRQKQEIRAEKQKVVGHQTSIKGLKAQVSVAKQENKTLSEKMRQLSSLFQITKDSLEAAKSQNVQLQKTLSKAKNVKDNMKSIGTMSKPQSVEKGMQTEPEVARDVTSRSKPPSINQSQRESQRQITQLSSITKQQIKETEQKMTKVTSQKAVNTDEANWFGQSKEKYTQNEVINSVDHPELEPLESRYTPQLLEEPDVRQANRHNPSPPPKPISNKEFSRALKFTFMRK